ncbi:uncharacterized protein LOC143299073 isoform X1 [Babylonia areolata]|uniref:uncharacterized protein LOC143299073 isoform X1 n=1 Tax=Babylonia areolata TaxID=304850 RepID=UPI003FD45BC1
MATGRIEEDTTCSVCFERFEGRRPKILPCKHTFCLPCLKDLVDRESETCGTGGQDWEEEGERSARSLTCPTCRRVIPVPAGGVTEFQTNFNLDTDCRKEDPLPVLCSLCIGDEKAQFQCRKCQNNFCSRCRRYHDKFCKGTQVTVLQDPSDTTSSAQSPTSCQVEEQLKMVDDAMKKLTEEECQLIQERRAVDNSINVRYTTLLRHAADARDACLVSVRDECEAMTEQLHSSMTEARQTRDTLQQQLSPSQPAPVSAAQLRAALFLQGEAQMILNRKLDSTALLRHEVEDNTPLMINTLQSFMGKVVRSTQSSDPAYSKAASGSRGFQADPGTASSVGTHPRSLDDLYEKFEDLVGRVTSLQSSNTLLTQNVTQLSNANSKLSSEQSAVQREVTTVKDQNMKLTSDQAALQREMAALRDKNVIVHQDLAGLTAEKDRVSADLAKLHNDMVSMQTQVSMQQTDIIQLKADHGAVDSKLTTVQTDITALQADRAMVKNDVSQLKTDCSELKSDMAKVHKSISDLEGDHSALQTDMTASKNQVVSLELKMKSVQDSLQDNMKTLTAVETRCVKANTQVGFHAWMSSPVITNRKEQTLICDHVISSVGGGYDRDSGVFTAPLPGLYCFLATTSPRMEDVKKTAVLDIVLDGEVKGFVVSYGKSWSTGHTVVKMKAGQRVWLRSWGGGEYTFGGWWTSFSGMLVQADA